MNCSNHPIPGNWTILKTVKPPADVTISVLAKTLWIRLLLIRGSKKTDNEIRIPATNLEHSARIFGKFLDCFGDSAVTSLPIEKRYSGVRKIGKILSSVPMPIAIPDARYLWSHNKQKANNVIKVGRTSNCP